MTEREPGKEPAYVTGHNDDDGETIIVSSPGGIESVFGAAPLDSAEFRIRPDGTVMRYLLDGHL